MKRLVLYPACYLILIFLEAIFTTGVAFDFTRYEPVGWIAQGLAVLFASGCAEWWVKSWKSE